MAVFFCLIFAYINTNLPATKIKTRNTQMGLDLSAVSQIVTTILGVGGFGFGIWKYKQSQQTQQAKVDLDSRTADFKEGEKIREELREDYDRLREQLEKLIEEHGKCQNNLNILRNALVKAGIQVSELEV